MKSTLQKAQQGFTLIELVMVIVIIGILAAVALPKFFDLRKDAANAAVAGVAGALSSGSATNYAAKLVGNAGAITVGAADVCTSAIAGALVQGGMPTGYILNAVTPSCASPNETAVCSVVDTKNGVATNATIICAR